MIVPPGSLVSVRMFVVPLHSAAVELHAPSSGPHVNAIVPIGRPAREAEHAPDREQPEHCREGVTRVTVRRMRMPEGRLLDEA